MVKDVRLTELKSPTRKTYRHEDMKGVDSVKQSVASGQKFKNLVDRCFVMTDVWTLTRRVSEGQR
jgi:hypothetical protein